MARMPEYKPKFYLLNKINGRKIQVPIPESEREDAIVPYVEYKGKTYRFVRITVSDRVYNEWKFKQIGENENESL